MAKGFARKGWDLDLADGVAAELRVSDLLKHKVEVKRDEWAHGTATRRATGRVFIEYADHGRPSGIRTTRSARWAFEFSDGTLVFLSTDKLRRLCMRAQEMGMQADKGDDDSYSGFFIPLEWLIQSWGLEGPPEVDRIWEVQDKP